MIDAQYYSEKRVNDIRNPRRLVAVGDKFGYDYDIVRPGVTAFGTARYRRGRWTLNSAGELSFGALWRRGHYENAVFTGVASFGRSDRYNLTTYNLGLSAVYSFSVNHRVAVCGNIQECEPETGDVFLSPECHNYGASAVNNFNLGGEIRYEGFFAGVVRIEASAYLARERRGAEILRYYDDLYADYTADNLSGYSIMTMKGVTRNMGGLEVAINVDITPRLNLRGMAAFNRYVYVGDPEVGIASDANLQSRLVGSSAKLGGYVAGDSPQTMAAVSMRYNAPSRWRLEVTLSYAGDRYVSISPVRRTQRIAFLATSPEESAAFATQERLPDAYSLNAYISKGFTLFGINFFCSLSANNILDKDIIYGGYEQNRIRKEGSGVNRTYKPFPSKYAYAYPRSFYAMLSVNF